jgi:hypothetical protein
MFHDALAHLERQVEAGKTGVGLLETLHDTERVEVVVEALAEAAHLAVEFLFARVGEGWVAMSRARARAFG